MRLRRRTREQDRHGRAAVRQELSDEAAAAQPVDGWKRQRAIECARMEVARNKATQ
jgi:hypothetical protein